MALRHLILKTVILRPDVGRRISRDAWALVAASRLSGRGHRERAGTRQARLKYSGRSFGQHRASGRQELKLQIAHYITHNKANRPMSKTTSFITFILILTTALSVTAAAQTDDLPPGAISSFQPQKSGDRTEQAYDAGKQAIYEGNWQKALDSYSQVIKAGGAHVDEALYWQAVAQKQMGDRAAALRTIAQLKRQYPRSSWIKDATALEQEIQPKAVDPDKESDCDLKLLAVNSLMNSDPDQAIPIIEKLLNNGGNSGQCEGQDRKSTR